MRHWKSRGAHPLRVTLHTSRPPLGSKRKVSFGSFLTWQVAAVETVKTL